MAVAKFINKSDLRPHLVGLHPIIRGTLFGGDRYECIDEAIILEDEDDGVIALATIAPEGEQSSGEPTIVGFYVHKPYRRQGHGRQLMVAVIGRAIERNLTPLRVDALSKGMLKICDSVPPEFRELIDVKDFSGLPDMLGEL